MIKKNLFMRFLAAVCALLLSMPATAEAAGGSRAGVNAGSDGGGVGVSDDFRAVWVSSVLNLDFPSEPGLSNAKMRAEINAVVARVKQLKLNAIILQVRPSGDALYKSDLFPWSEYLSGTRGKAPANSFDPLAHWIRQAHRNGLELHAWINPFRITHPQSEITDVNALPSGDPARKEPSRAVAYNGALYYDPGLPANRRLIIDGVAEIVRKYDVDGIHLDDYFYPGTDFPDGASFAAYGGGMDRGDWRRENVNAVVRGIQAVIADEKPDVRYGISPFAIWQNASSSPSGSDTRGNESYKNMYADTRRWVREGWVDYICPQIYWQVGYEIADYAKVLAWWADVCEDTGVDLYVGHAAYREAEEDTAERVWNGEIVRQLKLNEKQYRDTVKGDVFFRYGSLDGTVGQQIRRHYIGVERARAAG